VDGGVSWELGNGGDAVDLDEWKIQGVAARAGGSGVWA